MDTLVEYSTLSQASGHSSSQFELENEARCALKQICLLNEHGEKLFKFESATLPIGTVISENTVNSQNFQNEF